MKYRIYFIIIFIMIILSGCTANEKSLFIDTLSVEQQYYSYECDNICYYFDNGIYFAEKYDTVSTFIPNTEKAEVWCVDNNDYTYFSTENLDIYKVEISTGICEFILNVSSLKDYDDDSVSILYVSDNNLIIKMGSPNLYLYNFATNEAELINHDARSLEFLNGKAYFCGRDFSIHEFDIQSRKETVLFKSDYSEELGYYLNKYKNFIFIGDEMYYYMRDPYGMYKFDGEKSVLISEDEKIDEFSLCEYHGILYFIEFPDENGKHNVFKYNPSDENISFVLALDNYSRDAKIINNCLYYKTDDYSIKKIILPE